MKKNQSSDGKVAAAQFLPLSATPPLPAGVCPDCLQHGRHLPDCIDPTPEMVKARELAEVRADHNNRVVIVIKRESNQVHVLRRNPVEGHFEYVVMGTYDFDHAYARHLKDYPVRRAARLFAGFMESVGGTESAWGILDTLINVRERKTMPEVKIRKKDGSETTVKTEAEEPKNIREQIRENKAKGGNGHAKSRTKVIKEPKERRRTVASAMQELIMEGRLTDDEIFERVAKEFSLPPARRSYVSWYRNYLRKKDMNPPDAVQGKEPKARPPKAAKQKS